MQAPTQMEVNSTSTVPPLGPPASASAPPQPVLFTGLGTLDDPAPANGAAMQTEPAAAPAPPVPTVRALLKFGGDAPGLVIVVPTDASVGDVEKIAAPRVAERYGEGARCRLAIGGASLSPGVAGLGDSRVFDAVVILDAACQTAPMRTPRAAAPRRRREYVYDSDADSGNEEGLLPAADVPPPEDEAQLRARARVLFAEISMLTDGRDKHYKSDVRRALARNGWRVNETSNQEMGARPPDGWPRVAEILARNRNASKTSIRTITGANGIVRYLELAAPPSGNRTSRRLRDASARSSGRVAATPRGATWPFRGHRTERTKIDGRRRTSLEGVGPGTA